MNVLIIILCAVSLTYSIFLLGRFAIKKRESEEFVSDTNNLENVNK